MTSKPHSEHPAETLKAWLELEKKPLSEITVDEEVEYRNYDPRNDVGRLIEQLEAAHEALEHIVSMTPSANFIETAKSWASKGLNPATESGRPGLREQLETLNTAAREWIEMCDRDDNPAYPAATLAEVDRLQKALRDAVSFPATDVAPSTPRSNETAPGVSSPASEPEAT